MGSKLAGLALLLWAAGTTPAQQPGSTSPYHGFRPQTAPTPVTVQPRVMPAALDARPIPMPTTEPITPPDSIQQMMLQQPMTDRADTAQDTLIPLEPPGRERLYTLHSEAALFERWRQEMRQKGERAAFPEEPVLSRDPYLGRAWPERPLYVEPNYVNYGRLLFEEKNSERYGWDFGALSAVVSTGYFFKDAALLPYHRFTDPCRCFDSNAGYCLPGDPVPYKLYPEGLSTTGALAEAAAIVSLLAIFP